MQNVPKTDSASILNFDVLAVFLTIQSCMLHLSIPNYAVLAYWTPHYELQALLLSYCIAVNSIKFLINAAPGTQSFNHKQ